MTASGAVGHRFPAVTIRDMVRAQKRLIDHFGISRLFAVTGGSLGGMQVLEWAATYPECVFAAVPIASPPGTRRRTSPSTKRKGEHPERDIAHGGAQRSGQWLRAASLLPPL